MVVGHKQLQNNQQRFNNYTCLTADSLDITLYPTNTVWTENSLPLRYGIQNLI